MTDDTFDKKANSKEVGLAEDGEGGVGRWVRGGGG